MDSDGVPSYLKNIEGMDSFHKLKIPISEHQEILKEQNKSMELQFMEWLAFQKFNTSETVKCKPSELMELFTDFLMINCINDYRINSIKLGVRIALLKLKGFEKKHDNKGSNYIINILELKSNFNYFNKS